MRLSFTFGRRRVSNRLIAIIAFEVCPLPRRQFVELGAQAAFQILHDHRNQRHVSDAVAHKSIAHELRTQGAQMHDAGSADERPDEAHHEIDGVIGGENAQIPHSWPEGIPRGQRAALFQIILVREDATLGTAAGSRGIDDAGDVVFLAHDEIGSAFALEIFPAKGAGQIHAQRGFGHQNDLGSDLLKVGRLHDRPPQVVLDDEHLGLGMSEQLQMLRCR